MKILLSSVFSIALLFSIDGFSQTPIADITLSNTLKAGTTSLVLNGAGIREKFWIDVYVGALYLPAKSKNAPEILSADKPMAIKLHILTSAVTREKMKNGIEEGFMRSTAGNIAPVKARMEQLLSAFSSEIKVGDEFDMIYEPGKGISLYKNGAYGITISGLDFKAALFGTWLGPDPGDKELKKALLGS
jgi:hypothetical protein